MKKLGHNLNLYRQILIITASLYLIFAAAYNYTPVLTDPMSLAERLITAGIIFTVYLCSYKFEWIKNKIDIITFSLSALEIIQLFYYTYLQDFKVELVILTIFSIAILNLIFNLNLLKFITNIFLILIITFLLYFSESKQIVFSFYLTSYIIIAVLSFYVSYNIEKSQKRIAKNLIELKKQHEFQKTLADISSELVNQGLDNFDSKINNSLRKIGEFFDIDRSYIFKISDDRQTMSNIYEWTAAEIKSQANQLQSLKTDEYKWWFKKLKEGEAIVIESLDQLDKEAAAEKELLKDKDVQSLIVMPIFIAGELYGFFGFDLVNSNLDFNHGRINQLKIFTNVITRAIYKHRDDLKIKELSYYDSLTGLYNRRFFEVELERLDSKRQLPISIIMADLNGLKIINDCYGHKKGDLMLKKAADTLKNSLRKEDILARQGGDEFIILLPQTDAEVCAEITKRINAKTETINDVELPLSIALGQATKVSMEENINEIIKNADNQMYENKLFESRSSKSNIVQGLINALEAKSSETKEHTMRMTELAFDFGEKLGLSESEQNRLSLLATLHDIGKININEEILNKKDKLTDEEWKVIKKHTEQGYKIAFSSEEFAAVAEEIFSHHENWDGSGYPRSLERNEIPFLARIISVIDAYDVMTNERPYSEAVSKEEALAEIKRCAGGQFDPDLADQFIGMLKKE